MFDTHDNKVMKDNDFLGCIAFTIFTIYISPVHNKQCHQFSVY